MPLLGAFFSFFTVDDEAAIDLPDSQTETETEESRNQQLAEEATDQYIDDWVLQQTSSRVRMELVIDIYRPW